MPDGNEAEAPHTQRYAERRRRNHPVKRQGSVRFVSRQSLNKKKNPRAAVWLIYLNLVARGESCERLQASKFSKKSLHTADRPGHPSNRTLAQIRVAITNIAGASIILVQLARVMEINTTKSGKRKTSETPAHIPFTTSEARFLSRKPAEYSVPGSKPESALLWPVSNCRFWNMPYRGDNNKPRFSDPVSRNP